MAQPFISLIDVGTELDEALLVLKVSDLCVWPEGRRLH